MKINIGTFNLFQFVEPPYSWYVKKDKFTQEQWEEKTSWIKSQIENMNCDIIGFQEVFSSNALKKLVEALGFKYFYTVDTAKIKPDSKTYISTTVAIASKYPILNLKKIKLHVPSLKPHNFKGHFDFARVPIKADIQLPNETIITVYVCHFKSNRDNEFEYVFNKSHTLNQKLEQVKKALENNYSQSLKQRLCEASSIFFDIKKNKKPSILVADLNDKEFSITIDALSNNKYHDEKRNESLILYDASYQYKKKIYNPHPEQKEIPRTPTSYFVGKGNVLDFIFISNDFNKKNKQHIGKVTNYKVLDKHLQENSNGSILKSDHAQVVCEIEFL